MYESFYLRAVSPDEPVGAWIRYTVQKAPRLAAHGSLWVSVFDASAGAPFMYKQSSDELTVPGDGWIAIGGRLTLWAHACAGCIELGVGSGPALAPAQTPGPTLQL